MTAVKSYAQAMLAIAEADGDVEGVADELFRFNQALEGSNELTMTLSDRTIDASRRSQIVEDLLDGKASNTTIGLVSMVVNAGRARELGEIVNHVVQLSAAGQDRQVAFVRSAVALSDDQQSRLSAALAKQVGSDIDLKVSVDPSVVGGIVTTIGDTVIDGSVRSRLSQLREAF
ncbi:MAG: ATP synthase F1 subunit delta [Acidimicrobiales bacterium]|mgnify:CR=1 FL=1|jgi:F-type H+-transporting ATPase subunit delta